MVLEHQYSLEKLNTFGLPVKAELFASPENIENLGLIFRENNQTELPLLIIGEGSNILFTDNFYGLVIKPCMKGVELLEDDGKQVLVKVGASENWDRWVDYATGRGWFGLENLSLIPGSVGASPVQNIGAYGVELSQLFAWLEAYDSVESMVVRLDKEKCRFGYRTSIFRDGDPGRYIITHVVFRLEKTPRLNLEYGNIRQQFDHLGGKTPADLRKSIIAIRNSKLPRPSEFGNAGSFFKNPEVDRTLFNCLRAEFRDVPNYPVQDNQIKIPAAWLIEQAGWKGKRIGNVGTWPIQPLVIVNYGDTTGKEILEFSEQIRRDVEKKFGILLEREVTIL
jgi:UDP-N-acetylmuramate dehydrogenase